MGQRGGKREGAGRKPKADEIKRIEQMDETLSEKELIELHADLVRKKDMAALKLWYQYRYGNPDQSVDVKTQGDQVIQVNYGRKPD